MENNNNVPIVNMRSFFSREIFMHAIGDVRFKKPIALRQALYTMVFLLIYSLPIVYFFGFILSIWYMIIVFVPPVALGTYANKPIWGGRTLIDFTKVTFGYLKEPKGWTDHRANNELNNGVYEVKHDYWVSRRRELNLLAGLKEEIKTGKRTDHRILYEDENGEVIDVIDTLPQETLHSLKTVAVEEAPEKKTKKSKKPKVKKERKRKAKK